MRLALVAGCFFVEVAVVILILFVVTKRNLWPLLPSPFENLSHETLGGQNTVSFTEVGPIVEVCAPAERKAFPRASSKRIGLHSWKGFLCVRQLCEECQRSDRVRDVHLE